MDWLDPDTLDAIYDAAVTADLVDRDTRTVLLQGVGDDVRLALPDHARPDLQFRSDLQRLNVQPAEAAAPLRAWLAEAAHLAEGRPAAAVFSAALDRPDASPAAVDPGPPPEPTAPPDPPQTDPAGDSTDRPPWLLPALIGGGIAGVGLLVALAVGGDPEVADAGPPDGGRTILRPLAVKVAEPGRGRPALYRVNPGSVAVEDVDGPRSVAVERVWAWSRTPITAAQFRAITGGLPDGRTADETPIVGLSARELRAFCDGLSRAEGHRPYYAEGGDGYRLPPEDAWVFTCVGGRGGPPAPGAWGLNDFGPAETVADGADRDAALVQRGGLGGIGVAACTAGRRVIDGAAPAFRVVRPVAPSADTGRPPLVPLPVPR